MQLSRNSANEIKPSLFTSRHWHNIALIAKSDTITVTIIIIMMIVIKFFEILTGR